MQKIEKINELNLEEYLTQHQKKKMFRNVQALDQLNWDTLIIIVVVTLRQDKMTAKNIKERNEKLK